MSRPVSRGSGVDRATIGAHEYGTLHAIREMLGAHVNWPWVLRDWARRHLLDTGDPAAPGIIPLGRVNWYRMDRVTEVEHATRDRTRRRAVT